MDFLVRYFNRFPQFEVVWTDIDKETLDRLRYLASKYEKELQTKESSSDDPMRLMSWRR